MPDFEEYANSRQKVMSNVDITKIDNKKVLRIMKIQYMIESFLEPLLSEKVLYAYYNMLAGYHKVLITDIFKQCKNLKFIFGQISLKNFDYLGLFNEFLDIVRCNSDTMVQILHCISKINFSEWVIQQLHKVRLLTCCDTLVLDFNDSSIYNSNSVISILNLHQMLMHKDYDKFVNNYFSSQEKTANYRSLYHLVLLMFQQENRAVRSTAFLVFETLLSNINGVIKKCWEEGDGPKYCYKGALAEVIVRAIQNPFVYNNPFFVDFLGVLAKYKEHEILAACNEEMMVVNLIDMQLDFVRRKPQAVQLLSIFRALLAKSNDHFASRTDKIIERIYAKMMDYYTKSKRYNIIWTTIGTIRKLFEEHSFVQSDNCTTMKDEASQQCSISEGEKATFQSCIEVSELFSNLF